MQRIGPRLGHNVDRTAAGVAKARVGLERFHLYLGNGVHGRTVSQATAHAGVRRSIQQQLVLFCRAAAHGEPGRAAVVEGTEETRIVARYHSERQLRQNHRRAAVERHVFHLFTVDHLAGGGGLGLQERRLGADRDAFAGLPYFEGDVERNRFIRADPEARAHVAFEARRFDENCIRARREERQVEPARRPRQGVRFCPGFELCRRDPGSGDDGALRVQHKSGYCAPKLLSEDGAGQQTQQRHGASDAIAAFEHIPPHRSFKTSWDIT